MPPPRAPDGDAVLKVAQDYLAQTTALSPLAAKSGRLCNPIIIRTPSGQAHSWMVPVAVAEKLAGFFQILPDLTVLRYSSFQRQPDTLSGCPDASLWLDTHSIRKSAASFVHKTEQLSEPVLTFDRNPARLVWALTATNPSGKQRTILVAGDFVFAAAETEGGKSRDTQRDPAA